MKAVINRNGVAMKSSITSLLLAMLLLGCKSEGSACFSNYSSSCDGDVLVRCEINKTDGIAGVGKGKIVRTSCEKACNAEGGNASCVEDKAPCDPKTFTPSCGEDAAGEFSIVCRRQGEKYYPVRERELSCKKDGMSCINPNPTYAICVQDKTPCTPEGFQPRCLSERQMLSCTRPGEPDVTVFSEINAYPVTTTCDEGETCSSFKNESGEERIGCHPKSEQ